MPYLTVICLWLSVELIMRAILGDPRNREKAKVTKRSRMDIETHRAERDFKVSRKRNLKAMHQQRKLENKAINRLR